MSGRLANGKIGRPEDLPSRRDGEASGLHATLADSQHERFHELKNQSMRRMDYRELTNGEFVTLLMDVWEHHLDGPE